MVCLKNTITIILLCCSKFKEIRWFRYFNMILNIRIWFRRLKFRYMDPVVVQLKQTNQPISPYLMEVSLCTKILLLFNIEIQLSLLRLLPVLVLVVKKMKKSSDWCFLFFKMISQWNIHLMKDRGGVTKELQLKNIKLKRRAAGLAKIIRVINLFLRQFLMSFWGHSLLLGEIVHSISILMETMI